MFYDFIYLAKGFRMRPKVWSTLRDNWYFIKDILAQYSHTEILK